MSDTTDANVLGLTAQIVAAHAEHNELAADALPDLIRSVYRSLATVTAGRVYETQGPIQAVPVKWSVFPDHLICLEDGRKLKTLKRHLAANHCMSVEDYRIKWGLPPDYPKVAPSYKASRSAIAKTLGLGRKVATVGLLEPVEVEGPEVTVMPARRARRSRG